jgi:pilus assembly protein Flp/PilA
MGLSVFRKQPLARFFQDASGAVSIEYAIIASLISIAAIGGIMAIGGSVSGFFASIQGAFR